LIYLRRAHQKRERERVVSIATFACKTWKMMARNVLKLDVCCLKKILQVMYGDRATNEAGSK